MGPISSMENFNLFTNAVNCGTHHFNDCTDCISWKREKINVVKISKQSQKPGRLAHKQTNIFALVVLWDIKVSAKLNWLWTFICEFCCPGEKCFLLFVWIQLPIELARTCPEYIILDLWFLFWQLDSPNMFPFNRDDLATTNLRPTVPI